MATLPSPNPIPNSAVVNYQYVVDPSIPVTASNSNLSNIVNTQVNQAFINNADGGMIKSANPTAAQVGSTVTYTIALRNTGNTTANNVSLSDTIPIGTTFANNVTVNGVAQPGANPNPPSSIPIGSLGPGATSTVTFQVTVVSLPASGTIPNDSTAHFVYTVNPASPNGAIGGGNSNTVIIGATQATISPVKSASPTAGGLGATITYTVVLRNTGNTTANNAFFSDTIPFGTTFANNVTVNGVAQPGANPNPPSSIPLGNINPGSTATVTFQVIITTLPASGAIPNNSTVNFVFTSNPSIPNGSTGGGNSNTAVISVNQASINNPVKTASPTNVTVGSTVTYSVALTNTGNTTATSVFLSDTIPVGTTFANNVTVNGVARPGANPNPPSSIPVGSIGPGATSTVSFQVTVVSLPVTGTIPNDSTVNFIYTANPSIPNGATGSGNSNTAIIGASQAVISNPIKTANPAFTGVGGTVTYSIAIRNTGNTTANNVNLSDTIPVGTAFADNVTVNGVAQPGANPAPPNSIPVGSIGPGATSTLTFDVVVNTIPASGTIPNNATINFLYTSNPSIPNGSSGSANTNTAIIGVGQAIIDNATGGLTKSYSPPAASVGTTVTYTITLKNTGNVTATSVFLSDTITAGSTFADNVTVNGVAQPGANPNPPSSIPVGNIGPGATAVVRFNVLVSSIPSSGNIINDSTVNFRFTSNPSIPNGSTGSGNSNTTTIPVNQAVIDNANGGLTKSVIPTSGGIGTNLTYTVTLTNTGNVTANNVFFSDTVPTGTTFNNNVIVNGVAQPGANPNPPSSIPLGSIGPGATATVSFQVTVTTLPPSGSIPNSATVNFTFTQNPSIPNGATGRGNSNIVRTPVNQANIDNANGGMTKTVNPTSGGIGTNVTFTVTLTNTGNTTANNVFFSDTIPPEITFNDNVTVNGIAQPGANPNPPSNIPLGNISPGATARVSFQGIINTLPSSGTIRNDSTINFTYTSDPSVPNGSTGGGNSNPAILNTNQAIIDNASGGFIKSATPAAAGVGTTITYTITLRNTGNATANNVVFLDTIPTSVNFVANSVTLNGSVQPGANPNPPTGVPIGSIGPGVASTVTYSVVVNTIPQGASIPNSGTTRFVYTQNPSIPNGATGSGNTNIIITPVNQATIKSTKSTDKAFADLGDIITYTILVTNSGNVDANNVVITDAIPSGTSYQSGSLTVDGAPNASDPTAGITIATINPGQTSTIKFQVKVNQVPAINPLINQATGTFTYTLDPSVPNGGSGTLNTNPVSTTISHGQLLPSDTTKTADKTSSTVGDTINYTIATKNTGNVAVNNVVVLDTIIAPTSFVNGSVKINSVSQPSANPSNGIPVGTLNPNQAVTVTFQVNVASTIPATIVNAALINYNYIVSPTLPPKNASTPTNTTTITNLNANLAMSKSSGVTGALVGDTIVYTISIVNTGQIDANNVVVKDPLNPSLTFADSVTVNGVSTSGNITNGINIGNIPVGTQAIVRFNATVTTVPSNGDSINQATANYTVTPPGGTTTPASNMSNINHLTVFRPSVVLTKSSDKVAVKVGDNFNYTIIATNNGDIPITNAVITDTLPSDFTVQQVTVDGVVISGDPASGISIGTLNVAETKIIIITVKAVAPHETKFFNTAVGTFTVAPDPNSPPVTFTETATDTTGVTVFNPQLQLTKSVNKTSAAVGDVITYTVVAKNTNGVTLQNVIVQDVLPSQLQFVSKSVSVNGVSVPNANILSGVNIGTLPAGVSSTVTFDAKVISQGTGTIPNIATGNFQVILPGTTVPQCGTTISNTVTVSVVNAHISVTKQTDATLVSIGTTIAYTVTIVNDGQVDASNVIFKDSLPTTVSIVNGSFTINGVVVNNVNPRIGINIGNMPVGSTKTITYIVTVLSGGCESNVVNSANVTFKIVLSDGSSDTITSESSSTTVNVNLSTFKQLILGENLVIPCQKPDIEEVNRVKAKVEILNCHVIETSQGRSTEGQVLGGHKLIVQGVLSQLIEYTAANDCQSVHSAHFNTAFSSFIILPVDFVPGSSIDVVGEVEHISTQKVSERCLFTDATVLLVAKIRPNTCM